MSYQCKLWKITIEHLYPNDTREQAVFWGYHFSEGQARDAALRWAAVQAGGSTITTILSVDPLA